MGGLTPWLSMLARAGLRGGTAGQLPGEPAYEGRYDITGMIATMVLVKSSFQHGK